MDNVAQKLGIKLADVDLVEINEAFAVVAMACADLCKIDHARVNVRAPVSWSVRHDHYAVGVSLCLGSADFCARAGPLPGG
jgi:acetyl-CoA acetyltransferase